jgi:hypothetical protein
LADGRQYGWQRRFCLIFLLSATLLSRFPLSRIRETPARVSRPLLDFIVRFVLSDHPPIARCAIISIHAIEIERQISRVPKNTLRTPEHIQPSILLLRSRRDTSATFYSRVRAFFAQLVTQ